jgi:hypothetical protein
MTFNYQSLGLRPQITDAIPFKSTRIEMPAAAAMMAIEN